MTDKIPEINVLVQSDREHKNYTFNVNEIIVGRSKKSTLRIPIEGMSRAHFKISVIDEAVVITDLGSANGTLLNGKYLRPNIAQAYQQNDVVKIPGINVSFYINYDVVNKESELSILDDFNEDATDRAYDFQELKVGQHLENSNIIEKQIAENQFCKEEDEKQEEFEIPVQKLHVANSEEAVSLIPQNEDEVLSAQSLMNSQEIQKTQAQVNGPSVPVYRENLEDIQKKNDATVIQFEKNKQINLKKIEEDSKVSKNLEIKKMNDLLDAKNLEMEIINEEFNKAKKIELEKIKELERQKETELLGLKNERDYGFRKVKGECEKLKERLLEEAREEAKKEKERILLEADEEKEKLLKSSRISLDEAKKEAQELLLAAEEEIRKRKDDNYEEILDAQKKINIDLIKMRKDAEEESKSYFKLIKEESEQLLANAKTEADKFKEAAEKEISQLKLSIEKETHFKLDEADRLKKESSKIFDDAKMKSEQILKDAYATAMLMKNTSQEKDDTEEISEAFFEEIEDQYPEYESVHKKHIQNIFSLVNKTTEEMDQVLKEKQEIFDDENKHMLEAQKRKVQLKAKEEALKIKALAENEAQEIIRNAYVHSKLIETEANTRVRKKDEELQSVIVKLNNELKDKKRETTALDEKRNDLKKMIVELEKETKRLAQLKDEKEEEYEVYSYEVSEKEKVSRSEIKKLEVEHNHLTERLDNLNEKYESFNLEYDDKKTNLTQLIFDLTAEKDKLDVVVAPLREAVDELKKEKVAIYQENSSFLENLDIRKTEYENLKNINDSLDMAKDEKTRHVEELNENIKDQKSHLAKLHSQIGNIEAEIIAKRESFENEVDARNIDLENEIKQKKLDLDNEITKIRVDAQENAQKILHDAKIEEVELQKELELIKANKKAYADEEIEQLKLEASQYCDNLRFEAEQEKERIIETSETQADNLRTKTQEWIKEIQDKIDAKNKEIEKNEVEGKQYLAQRRTEIEKEYNERIQAAEDLIKEREKQSTEKINNIEDRFQEKIEAKNKEIKKNEEECKQFLAERKEEAIRKYNEKIEAADNLIKDREKEAAQKVENIKGKFQERMRQQKEVFEIEKKDFFESAQKSKENVLADARRKGQELIESAKKEEMTILQKRNDVLESLNRDAEELKSKLDEELSHHKKLAEKEISKMKIKAFENQKANRALVEKQIESRKKTYVSDITENVIYQLQITIKNIFGPKMSDQHFEKLKLEISDIVDAAVFPAKKSDEQPKKMLMGTGKLTENIKGFYKMIAIGVGIPVFILILNAVFPSFFPGIKKSFVSTIKSQDKASDSMFKKEMEKKRNRPKFQPPYSPGFKDNYTDNILYTKKYAELVVNRTYIDKWTITLNNFLVDELGLSEEIIVKLISYENNMHRQLIEIKDKINIDFAQQGIVRMREKELEFSSKIKDLFKSEKDFISFMNFKRTFFNNYIENKVK